jgi:hypothetical protein
MKDKDYNRDDFLLLRSKKFRYTQPAKSASQYIFDNWNVNKNLSNEILDKNNIQITLYSINNNYVQFDFISPYTSI